MDTSSEQLLTPADLPSIEVDNSNETALEFLSKEELESNEKSAPEKCSMDKAETEEAEKLDTTPDKKRKRQQLDNDVAVVEIEVEPSLAVLEPSGSGTTDLTKATQVESDQLAKCDIMAAKNNGYGSNKSSSPLRKKLRSMLPVVPEESRSGEDVESGNELQIEQQPEPKCICFKYCRRVNKFANSMYMVPVHLVIFAFAVAAGLMGARYMKECPMSPSVPLLLFMMSLAALLSVMLRMVDVCTRHLFPTDQCGFLKVFSTFGFLTHVLLLITEMMAFMKVVPSYEESAENYCNPTFYWFLGWINWLSVALGLLMVMLHSPAMIPNSILHS